MAHQLSTCTSLAVLIVNSSVRVRVCAHANRRVCRHLRGCGDQVNVEREAAQVEAERQEEEEVKGEEKVVGGEGKGFKGEEEEKKEGNGEGRRGGDRLGGRGEKGGGERGGGWRGGGTIGRGFARRRRQRGGRRKRGVREEAVGGVKKKNEMERCLGPELRVINVELLSPSPPLLPAPLSQPTSTLDRSS